LFLEPAYLKYSTFQITSSLKQQYKLLLEQKAIKYVYPGDSSPTTREGAWQIVMSVQEKQQIAATGARQSNSSDPASDSSQLEEDVFTPPSSEDAACSSQTAASADSTTVPASIAEGSATTADVPPPPAPPSYSEAVARQSGEQGGVRFQQQQLPAGSMDGILPATRARLASLKSLGSKKLQAIKMRLSDQRQKFDECA